MDLLPTVEFVVNSWLNSATGHTPFELLYGYTPDFTIPAGRPMGIPLVDKCLQHLRTLRIDAEAALCLSKECMKLGHPKSYGASALTVGDKVWLQAKQIKIHQQSAKLGPKQLGPFEITEVLSDVNYRLKLPPALQIHNVFHVDCLSLYKGNKVNGLELPPPQPVTVDGEEEYEVDHIRDSKMFGRTLKYLVCWKGYGEGEDTWEPEQNLKHAVKKQPSQDVLHGDKAEEELGLARLVSSYTLPHQSSQPGERGRQTARSKVLSRRARDT